jgi:hypothetical protein
MARILSNGRVLGVISDSAQVSELPAIAAESESVALAEIGTDFSVSFSTGGL